MSRHVLTCDCGRQLEVDTARAGETIACECGKTIAVPTLRQLRELPLAVEKSPAKVTREWGAKQGLIAACSIVAALCLLIAAYSRLTQPKLPEFDPKGYTRMADEMIDSLTPIKAWDRWVNYYRPLGTVGFQEFHHPQESAIEEEIGRRELLQAVMAGIAGIALVIAGAYALMGRAPSNHCAC